MKKNLNKKAFTLAEMLLVIAIILVLSAVTSYGVSNYLKYANEKAALVAAKGNTYDQVQLDVNNLLNASPWGMPAEPTEGAAPGGSGSGSGSTGNGGAGGGSGSGGSILTPTPQVVTPDPEGNPDVDPNNGGNGGNPGGSGSGVPGTDGTGTGTGTLDPTINKDEYIKTLGGIFGTNLPDNGGLDLLGKQIASNKPELVNEYLSSIGVTNSCAFITNDSSIGKYATGICNQGGITGINSGLTKVVSVSTDGTVLSDHKKGDTISVVQYIYYESKDSNKQKTMYLYATREVDATITNAKGKGSLSFDMSDTDGSSWTIINGQYQD